MLSYFQWIATAGVRGALLVLAASVGVSAFAYFQGLRGWGTDGMLILSIIAGAFSVHALGIAAVIALCLVSSGRSSDRRGTIVHGFVGGSVSVPLLAVCYFNVWGVWERIVAIETIAIRLA